MSKIPIIMSEEKKVKYINSSHMILFVSQIEATTIINLLCTQNFLTKKIATDRIVGNKKLSTSIRHIELYSSINEIEKKILNLDKNSTLYKKRYNRWKSIHTLFLKIKKLSEEHEKNKIPNTTDTISFEKEEEEKIDRDQYILNEKMKVQNRKRRSFVLRFRKMWKEDLGY